MKQLGRTILISVFTLGLMTISRAPVHSQVNSGIYLSTYFKYATVEGIDISAFGGLTIEGWIKMDQYMPFGNATGNPLFVKEPTFSSPYYNYGFILMVLNEQHYQGHHRRLAFGLNFGENGEIHIGLHSDHEVPLNEWHHLAGTWDGSEMKVYIDGTLDGTYDVSTLGPVYDPESFMHFGARLLGNQYAFHFGYIDEARIWNYARTESEIRETLYKEITGTEPGLYVCYHFNELGGQVLTDSGPIALNGYLGSTIGADYNDADRVNSTAPVPYYTVRDGNLIEDSVWATGQLAPFSGWARIAVNNSVFVDTTLILEDMTINTGGCMILNAGKFLTVNGSLINNGGNSGLVIKSDSTGTGSLIEHSGAAAIVERYLTDSCWHYVCPPVDDPLAGTFLGMFLQRWNEPVGTWEFITDENEVLATDMTGYGVWTNHTDTALFAGPLNAGIRTLTVTNQGLPGDSVDDGFNFAGNPYPSSIDWNADDGQGWTRTAGNVYNTLWIWNPASGNYGAYIKDFFTGTNGVDNIIAPHQGFFVYCSQPEGFISVGDEARIHSLKEMLKSTESEFPSVLLKVSRPFGSDEILLNIVPGTEPEYNTQTDALKIKGRLSAPQLYTLSRDSKRLTINTFPQTDEYRIIPLCFEAGEPGTYNLSTGLLSGFESFPKIVIEDLMTGNFATIKDTTTIFSFQSFPGDQADRFMIYLDGQPAEPDPCNDSTIAVYSMGRYIYVKSSSSLDGNITVYDPGGKELLSKPLNGDRMMKLQVSSCFGVVIVRVVTSRILITEKVLIRKT
jgi:hypothetical protein